VVRAIAAAENVLVKVPDLTGLQDVDGVITNRSMRALDMRAT
jgi:hypothetical protein